jgi:putative DNA primase/helicase
MYNLWRPFAMDTLKDKSYTPKPDALSFYLNHIKILCNNDVVVSSYIVAWIAQMIQYPEVKSIMPTFIAGEGIGKSTLIISLSKMMGASKILETTSPSRDVWGEFNGMMADAFLVHLCEISKKECVESRGKIKGLITDPTLNINNKGVGQYPVMSYHRFIATTNNEDSIPTEKGDRRNLVIRCSDEKKGDTEYFKKMYEYLEDVNVIRTLYDYFKGIPNMDKFHEIPLPKTEFQEDMKDSNRSPIELWLEDFTRDNSTKDTVSLKSGEVFNAFTAWLVTNNMKYDVNCVKFMVRLKNLNLDAITTQSTKLCKLKVFDIAKLEVYFGMGMTPPADNIEDNTDDESCEYEYVEE